MGLFSSRWLKVPSALRRRFRLVMPAAAISGNHPLESEFIHEAQLRHRDEVPSIRLTDALAGFKFMVHCQPRHNDRIRSYPLITVYLPSWIASPSHHAEGARCRVWQVLKHWLPVLNNLSAETDHTFSIGIDAGDMGDADERYLSMDGFDLARVVPDLYAMDTHRIRAKAEIQPSRYQVFRFSFDSKLPLMMWRGSTTGGYIWSLEDVRSNPRVQLCKQLRSSHPAIDLGLSRLVQIDEDIIEAAKAELIRESMFVPEASEAEIMAHRYYPDVPGNARAWGTLAKFLAGCLVFKPPSQQWLAYDPLLQPWRHFVPVAEDFSDLPDQVDWALKNHEEACLIAYRGWVTLQSYVRDVPHIMKTKALAYADFSESIVLKGEAILPPES
jgi:hypothetical protein